MSNNNFLKDISTYMELSRWSPNKLDLQEQELWDQWDTRKVRHQFEPEKWKVKADSKSLNQNIFFNEKSTIIILTE